MKKAWEMAKRYPYWVAGGVLAMIILIWWYGRDGDDEEAAANAGIYAITQDPNVIAANAAQALSQNQTNAAIALGGIEAQVMLGQFTSMERLAGINAGAAEKINAQNTSVALAIAQLNTNAAMQSQINQNATNFSLAQLGAATDLTKHGREVKLKLDLAGIAASLHLHDSAIMQYLAMLGIGGKVTGPIGNMAGGGTGGLGTLAGAGGGGWGYPAGAYVIGQNRGGLFDSWVGHGMSWNRDPGAIRQLAALGITPPGGFNAQSLINWLVGAPPPIRHTPIVRLDPLFSPSLFGLYGSPAQRRGGSGGVPMAANPT